MSSFNFFICHLDLYSQPLYFFLRASKRDGRGTVFAAVTDAADGRGADEAANTDPADGRGADEAAITVDDNDTEARWQRTIENAYGPTGHHGGQ